MEFHVTMLGDARPGALCATREQIDDDVVAALLFENGVQRLVNIADKMHGEFQRLDFLVAGRATQLIP